MYHLAMMADQSEQLCLCFTNFWSDHAGFFFYSRAIFATEQPLGSFFIVWYLG